MITWTLGHPAIIWPCLVATVVVFVWSLDAILFVNYFYHYERIEFFAFVYSFLFVHVFENTLLNSRSNARVSKRVLNYNHNTVYCPLRLRWCPSSNDNCCAYYFVPSKRFEVYCYEWFVVPFDQWRFIILAKWHGFFHVL